MLSLLPSLLPVQYPAPGGLFARAVRGWAGTRVSRVPDDLVLERSGAKVLIDPVSLEYLGGSEIDFVDDLIGATFKIRNPNATASCGCGTSFTI